MLCSDWDSYPSPQSPTQRHNQLSYLPTLCNASMIGTLSFPYFGCVLVCNIYCAVLGTQDTYHNSLNMYVQTLLWELTCMGRRTHWLHAGYTLVTHWSHTGYTLVTHWLHTGYTHTDHTLVTRWSHTGHMPVIHTGHTLVTQWSHTHWSHTGYTLVTHWSHIGHTLVTH